MERKKYRAARWRCFPVYNVRWWREIWLDGNNEGENHRNCVRRERSWFYLIWTELIIKKRWENQVLTRDRIPRCGGRCHCHSSFLLWLRSWHVNSTKPIFSPQTIKIFLLFSVCVYVGGISWWIWSILIGGLSVLL